MRNIYSILIWGEMISRSFEEPFKRIDKKGRKEGKGKKSKKTYIDANNSGSF